MSAPAKLYVSTGRQTAPVYVAFPQDGRRRVGEAERNPETGEWMFRLVYPVSAPVHVAFAPMDRTRYPTMDRLTLAVFLAAERAFTEAEAAR